MAGTVEILAVGSKGLQQDFEAHSSTNEPLCKLMTRTADYKQQEGPRTHSAPPLSHTTARSNASTESVPELLPFFDIPELCAVRTISCAVSVKFENAASTSPDADSTDAGEEREET